MLPIKGEFPVLHTGLLYMEFLCAELCGDPNQTPLPSTPREGFPDWFTCSFTWNSHVKSYAGRARGKDFRVTRRFTWHSHIESFYQVPICGIPCRQIAQTFLSWYYHFKILLHLACVTFTYFYNVKACYICHVCYFKSKAGISTL